MHHQEQPRLHQNGAAMKIRIPVTAAAVAVVLGTTGALVLPAGASAHSATHTLKFVPGRTAP